MVGISEIYSCLCFHAKETLWQFVHLYVPTTRCKSRIAILGIPLQWSCLMRGMVFLASPRLPPPPTASRCWTGSGHVNVEGTKQRHPGLLVLHGSQLRAPLHPTDWDLYTPLQRCQAAKFIPTRSQRCHHQHAFPLQLFLLHVMGGTCNLKW